MIIKKSMFERKEWADKWPFNVDEVAVQRVNLGDVAAFAICHEYKVYALSGILKTYGLAPLPSLCIWSDDSDDIIPEGDTVIHPPIKKSLSPFFEFCKWQSGRMG